MMNNSRLSPLALGLASGILWGVIFFILVLLGSYFAGAPLVKMGTLYVNQGPSLLTCILIGIIAFVKAFIFGFILAWLYNLFAGCTCPKTEKKKKIKPSEPVSP